MTDQNDEHIAEQWTVREVPAGVVLYCGKIAKAHVGTRMDADILAHDCNQLTARIAALEGERDEALAVFGPGWPHGLVETCQLLQAVDAAMDDVALADSYITDYLNGSVTEILSKRVQRLIERCRMWHDRQKASTIERDQAIAENAALRAALATEREKSRIYRQAIAELLCAMERYEMEVDESPTREHRAMMERARAALATPQPVEREKI